MQNLVAMKTPASKQSAQSGGRPATFTRQNIEVIFSVVNGEGVFQYRANGVTSSDLNLNVDSDQALLAFYIDPGTTPGTVFPASPFTWVKEEGDGRLMPIPTPGNFFCFSEHLACAIQDTNPLPDLKQASVPDQQFHFFISVMFDRKIYTSPDPTLINKTPPDGPGTGG